MNLLIKCTSVAGRVSHFLPNWEVLTQDQWVLHTVAGYQLDLISAPYQSHMPQQIQTTTENATYITAEVAELVSKGGNCGDSALPRQLCVPNIPGGKERWRSEAGDQLKGPQSVCGARALQDGGPPLTPRPPPAKGLDGKLRPEGCIPPGPNPPEPSAPSHLSLGGEILQIHLPTIRPVICTEGIYKVKETSGRISKAGGLSSNNIFGRSAGSTSGQAPVTTDNSIDLQAFRMSGPTSQSQKVYTRPVSEDGISWLRDTLSDNDVIDSSRENEEDSTRCSQTNDQTSKRGSSVCGQSNSYHAGPPNSSPPLQSTAIPDELCALRGSGTGDGNQQIQHGSAIRSDKEVRPIMVDILGQEFPVNPNCPSTSFSVNRVSLLIYVCYCRHIVQAAEYHHVYPSFPECLQG